MTENIKEKIIMGRFLKETLDLLFHQASEIKDIGMRIDFISEQFKGIKYKESTLIGDINTSEVFVINLEEVDCFTFLDYVEAMRLSDSFSNFKENLKKIRYKAGIVSFKNRNHFFTDWREFNSHIVGDVTKEIGCEKTIELQKTINLKEDGTLFLEGIETFQREICYIPSEAIDACIIDRLKTGDYIGIYSYEKGLDVSHAGIIIKHKNEIYLRHASSRKGLRKVVDQEFVSYILNKPGIIVLRPRSFSGF